MLTRHVQVLKINFKKSNTWQETRDSIRDRAGRASRLVRHGVRLRHFLSPSRESVTCTTTCDTQTGGRTDDGQGDGEATRHLTAAGTYLRGGVLGGCGPGLHLRLDLCLDPCVRVFEPHHDGDGGSPAQPRLDHRVVAVAAAHLDRTGQHKTSHSDHRRKGKGREGAGRKGR